MSTLFGKTRHQGCRVVVTGQVGVEKRAFLDEVVRIARNLGHHVQLCNVGEMMYAEAPDVVKGRILDLPRTRLNTLRRAVFKDILNTADRVENLIVNTHATFRWKHGLFEAFDFDHMKSFDADLYITLVDNVDSIHQRLLRDHDLPHSLMRSWAFAADCCVLLRTVSKTPHDLRRFSAISGESVVLYRFFSAPKSNPPRRRRVAVATPKPQVPSPKSALRLVAAYCGISRWLSD
jgi:adenylate kinase